MATSKEWESSVIGMTTEDQTKVQEAISVLGKWKLFKESYPEIISQIGTIVTYVHTNRIINTNN